MFKKMTALIIALTAGFALHGEALKVASYRFEASTLAKSPAHADQSFTKLTDGVLQPPSTVVWRYKENQIRPIRIEFRFAEPVRVSEASLYIFRGPRSYGIRQIKIFGQLDEAPAVPIGNLVLKHPYEIPSKEEFRSEKITLAVDTPSPIDRVTLEISGSGSYLGLNEVVFDGARAPVKSIEVKREKHPFDQFATTQRSGLSLKEEKGVWLFQNDHALYVIDPANGGCVQYAFDKKTQANLLKYGDKDNFGGIFNDRFYPGSYAARDSFRGVAYKSEPVLIGGRKGLRCTGTGRGGIFADVTIEKTYFLTAASPVLTVDYKIINDQANVIDFNYGLWLMGGVGGQKSMTFSYAAASGIDRIPLRAQTYFAPGASSGAVCVTAPNGEGLAMLSPYELLKDFLFWSNNNLYSTMECRLGVYGIKAGEALHSSFALAPYHGIGTPSNVTRSLAGSAEISEDGRTGIIRLLPYTPGDFTLETAVGTVGKKGTNFVPVASEKFQGRFKAETFRLALPPGNGTRVLRTIVKEHGKVVFSMYATRSAGASSGVFSFPPEAAKRPETTAKQAEVSLDFHSTAYRTKHIAWAKPFAGKVPRVLGICMDKGGHRDMVELAQRFDMKLTTSFLGGIWKISGRCTTLSLADSFAELAKQLKNDFDCIVVASRTWGGMPEEVQDLILSKVRAGSGLILVAPENHPAELAKLFRSLSFSVHPTGSWRKEAVHPVTSGVPFAILPPTRYLPYEVSGRVLASVDGRPLVAEAAFGKGRVLLLSYATDGRDRKEYHMKQAYPSILPLMLFNLPREVYADYHEHQMSLIGKALYYASRADSGVSGEVEAQDGCLTLRLRAAAPFSGSAEIILRDVDGAAVKRETQKLTLKTGENTVSFPLPRAMRSGTHIAEVICRNAGGAVLYWGGEAFTSSVKPVFSGVDLAEKIRKKSERLTGNFRTASSVPVRWKLTDNLGNVFAAGTGNHFDLPLTDCRTLSCVLSGEALQNGEVIDRIEREIMLYGAPDARKLQIIFGWPILSQKGVQHFLLEHYNRRLIELGANALVTFRTDTDAELHAARRLNLPILGSNAPASSGGKFPFKKMESTNKFELLRTPCLSENALKDKLENASNTVTALEKYGTLFRAGPDEANSITKFEGCFSPACQKEFRNYLKRVYGSLEALNQSWDTHYKNWDDIIAMTAAEAKKHTSYAPWLDHRSFMDWNRADAIGRIVKGMKKADPDQRYSLSGTQEPNAFNAWEHFQIMKHLEALQSYGGEHSIMQRCFTPKKLIWNTWIGYDNDHDTLARQLLSMLMQGATGFSVYSGGFYVNPDYTLPPRALELKKAFDRYKNGVGEAILNTDFVAYPIAFLYSPSSIKTDWMIDADDLRKGSVAGLRSLIGSQSLGYDYIASEELRTTDKLQQKYKVLFLPMISSLSGPELERIRSFVRAGGTVVADMTTGTFDDHGKPYKTAQAAELFGFAPVRPELTRRSAELSGNGNSADHLTLGQLKFTVNVFEANLKPTSAQVLGRITSDGKTFPVVLVNRYGKGHAIYFGCSLTNTVGEWGEMRYAARNQQNLQELQKLFAAFFTRHAVRPVGTVPTLKAASVMARHNGPVSLLGIIRDTAQARNIDPKSNSHDIFLAQKSHVYDLFTRKELGYTDRIRMDFAPDTQKLLVLSPYAIPAPHPVLRREQNAWILDITLPGIPKVAADHPYQVSLLDASGKAVAGYEEIVFGKGGRASWRFVLPLNLAPKGLRVQVTELLSGKSAAVPVP